MSNWMPIAKRPHFDWKWVPIENEAGWIPDLAREAEARGDILMATKTTDKEHILMVAPMPFLPLWQRREYALPQNYNRRDYGLTDKKKTRDMIK